MAVIRTECLWGDRPVGIAATIFLTVVYLFLVNFTKPLTWGDTPIYASQIVRFSDGDLKNSQFWEFGHLLWRPAGDLLWNLGESYWREQFDNDEELQVYAALQSLNLVFGYLAGLAAFGIAWRISHNAVAAVLVASAFLGWNANLNYIQSGTAYVPGLSLQLTGLYLLLGSSLRPDARKRAWAAGFLLGSSLCLWLPYLFGLPGIFLLAYYSDRNDLAWKGEESRTRLRWLTHAWLACTLVVVASFGIGSRLADIGSVGELKAWVADSSHGYQPDKKYVRVVTGLPRGWVETGDTGLALKRFVTKDPYVPLGVRDLLSTGLWKLFIYYAGLVALVWSLLRDREARPISLPFFLGVGSLLFFAVVVFEPSQPERWMPSFPVFLAAAAFVFRSGKALQLNALLLAAMLATIWVSNVAAYGTVETPGPESPAVSRIRAVKPFASPHSLVCLLSFRDEISMFIARFPFHPLNRKDKPQYYYVVEPGHARSAVWARDFAASASVAWRQQGDIWISKRLTAAQPLPSWGWAEADDPHLKWRDLSSFFESFAFDEEVGGIDGFLRIARSPANQMRLEAATGSRVAF